MVEEPWDCVLLVDSGMELSGTLRLVIYAALMFLYYHLYISRYTCCIHPPVYRASGPLPDSHG